MSGREVNCPGFTAPNRYLSSCMFICYVSSFNHWIAVSFTQLEGKETKAAKDAISMRILASLSTQPPLHLAAFKLNPVR